MGRDATRQGLKDGLQPPRAQASAFPVAGAGVASRPALATPVSRLGLAGSLPTGRERG